MSYEIVTLSIGNHVAAADYSATGNRFGAVSGANTITRTGAGGRADGVIRNKPAAGEPVEFDMDGILRVELGATVAAGALVMSDSTGRAITAATAGNQVLGRALLGGAVGNIVPIRFFGGGGVVAA